MSIRFPKCKSTKVETSGPEKIMVTIFDDLGFKLCSIELSLSQAEAISEHVRTHSVRSTTSLSGKELI